MIAGAALVSKNRRRLMRVRDGVNETPCRGKAGETVVAEESSTGAELPGKPTGCGPGRHLARAWFSLTLPALIPCAIKRTL